MYHLAVDPEFRMAGVGRVLLETCEQQAKLWGARHMRLTSLIDDCRIAARRTFFGGPRSRVAAAFTDGLSGSRGSGGLAGRCWEPE